MCNDVIYEIYPLTFNYAEGSKKDPFGGAYGNLKGITAMAEYISFLKVDAIWIAPFFLWDHNGFGYDIINYKKVDPMFGTEADFKELCEVYHKLGIRVYIDQVYNHCSQKNPWFQKSIKCQPPYTDFFVWQDARGYDKDGNPIPPNNWLSKWDASGESAWTWNEERQQFYMHSFDYTMPNLNINNPELRQELLKVAKHWFDLGADGFRLDATTHYGCDLQYRNNPIDENGEQMRIYDINNAVGALFLDELKALANTYSTPKTLLAEYVFDKGRAGNEKGIKTVRESICDTFYIGSLRSNTLENFAQSVEKALKLSPNGLKLNWAFSNHDMERAVTRIWGHCFTPNKSALLMELLLTLPGSICLYQGDELGMPNPQKLSKCKNLRRDYRNIWSIANNVWDGARTGFCYDETSHAKMALHPDREQVKYSISNQKNDENSTLNKVRRAIIRRKNSLFGEFGNIYFIKTEKDVIAFVRTNSTMTQKCLCIFNFGETAVKIAYQDKTYTIASEDVIYENLP